MIWAGSPFAQLIEFNTGLPTGAIIYSLLDANGDVLETDNVTPEAEALSYLLVIPGDKNECSLPLFETRTLIYHYTTATGLVSDRVTYKVHRPLPFPVTLQGVRDKLGIASHEIEDSAVDLALAYSEIDTMFGAGAIAAYEASGDRISLLITHAIEALAALQVLPTLQLAIAARESSGTNEYHRYGRVDWDALRDELVAHIARAREAVTPSNDPSFGVAIFEAITRADPVTGA